MLRYATALAVVAGLSLPAIAAEEYYVAQSAKDKKCEVTDKKPDGKAMMMIGKAAYKTEKEAETAMKAAAECK
jgi:hypothetical protein